jgi:hypothetical protein
MSDKKNIHILELSTYSQPDIIEDSKNDWVEYGVNNDHYEFLIDRYKNSTTNNSIINNVARLIYGKGLDASNASKKPNEFAQMKSLFKPKTLRALALNEYMLGCGVLQCIFDEKHTKVIRVEAVKTKHVRPAKCNEDGEIEAYYYSDNWTDTKKFPPKRIPAFGTSKEPIEFLVYGKDSIDLKYFSEVDYQACIPYCVLEEEISNYLINDTQNGFSGTKVVNFNSGTPSEEQQRLIANKVKGQLTGAQGDKVIIAFNDNQEEKTTVEDIPLNNAPEHYTYLSTEAQAKILNNHNVVSPMIVGITTANSGFSSNGDEIEVATKFFYNQTVKPHQELLIDAIDEILAFNGISLKLYFENLNLLQTREEVETVLEDNTKLGEEESKENNKNVETSQEFNLEEFLSDLGEPKEQTGWITLDEREVDYEDEETLNNHLAEMNKELYDKLENSTLLSKVFNFVSTGTARPTAISSQDKLVKDKFFKVRYEYVGNKSPERGFCKAMMRANKLYRREDIERMSMQPVNPGFGEGGSDTYNCFKFKGGARCRHKWKRVTMMLDINKDSDEFKRIGTRAAEIKGFKVTNPFEVSVYPKNLPLKGFSPNNKNLPSDVR